MEKLGQSSKQLASSALRLLPRVWRPADEDSMERTQDLFEVYPVLLPCTAMDSGRWSSEQLQEHPPKNILCRNCQEIQKQIQHVLLSNATEWADKELGKGSPWHLDRRNNKAQGSSWFQNKKHDVRVDSELAILDGQQHRSSCAESSETVDAMQQLLEKGQLEKVVDVLVVMDHVPPLELSRSVVMACTKRKSLALAKRVFTSLANHGLDHSAYLGEYVVNMLVKCGSLEDALTVFHQLQCRTAFSWTAIIFGYSEMGQGQDSLRLYHHMQEAGLLPNKYTFVSLIKACASLPNLYEGKRIHSEVMKYRCESNMIVGTCLVEMYVKCGSIKDAQSVFDRLTERDVVAWNAMLAGYAQQDQWERVLQIFEQMEEKCVSLDGRTFVSVLQACANLGENENIADKDGQSPTLNSLHEGKRVHAEARMRGYGSDVFVGNALISMYRKHGCMADAQQAFDMLSERDVVAWNAMLAGYAQQGGGENALQLFRHMREEAVSPDDRTFVSVLQACGCLAEKEDCLLLDGQLVRIDALQQGKAIHTNISSMGYESDIFIGSALISLYTKCGSIMDAQYVFDRLSKHDTVSWTALLAGYASQGLADNAMQLFYQMQEAGVSPDASTFVSVLQACIAVAENEAVVLLNGQSLRVKSLRMCKALHAEVRRRGYESHVFLGSALISMYAKCESILDAKSVFDGLLVRDVVSWTALIAAYGQQGQEEEVLKLYREMLDQNVSPDDTTYMCILQTCGDIGALDICIEIHQHFVSRETELSLLLASTLIHAYGKCARMKDAQAVFDGIPEPNVVLWTALMAGYARKGSFEQSLHCYDKMCLSGVEPNGLTFLSLLSACSHSGRVDKGVEYFECMSRDHGITPDIEHYASLVDVLGRAGCFSILEDLLSKMPFQPDTSLWLCLLGSCRKHGNVFLGEIAFKGVVNLKPDHGAAYVLMSNIYAQYGLWDRAKELSQLRQHVGAWKDPGQSWIKHEEKIHIFLVGDRERQRPQALYALLRKISLALEEGHIPRSLL